MTAKASSHGDKNKVSKLMFTDFLYIKVGRSLRTAVRRGVTFRDRKVTKRSHSFSAVGLRPRLRYPKRRKPWRLFYHSTSALLQRYNYLPLISTLYRPPFGGYNTVWVLVKLCRANGIFNSSVSVSLSSLHSTVAPNDWGLISAALIEYRFE